MRIIAALPPPAPGSTPAPDCTSGVATWRGADGPEAERKEHMSRIGRVIIIVAVVLIVGGIAFLATRDIPPPSAPVEKVIPNDRALHP